MEFQEMSTNSMMNFFESKLIEASEKFITRSPVDSNPGKGKQPSWMNCKTFQALKKKHDAVKRWKITKEGKDYQKYKMHRNVSKAKVRKLKSNLKSRTTDTWEKKIIFKYMYLNICMHEYLNMAI